MNVVCPKCGAKDDVDFSKVPPGRVLLRCEKCFASFEVTITASQVPKAKCETRGDELLVTCPHCSETFPTKPELVATSALWSCPSCEGIFRLAGTQEPQPSVELITEQEIPAEGLQELESRLVATGEEVAAAELAEEGMLPPLSEKERFTAQFIVKVAGAELGPVSFNVLEDWARSGMIPRDALVSKVDENRFHRADRMPELLPLFEGRTAAPGSGLKELLREETAATAILHGTTAGLLGGLVGGLLTAAVVAVGLWSPLPAFPSILQALVTAGGLVIVGAGIGAVAAVIGQWIIDYPWTAAVQIAIALVFALLMFAVNFLSTHFLDTAAKVGVASFIICAVIGIATNEFHHRLFEKP